MVSRRGVKRTRQTPCAAFAGISKMRRRRKVFDLVSPDRNACGSKLSVNVDADSRSYHTSVVQDLVLQARKFLSLTCEGVSLPLLPKDIALLGNVAVEAVGRHVSACACQDVRLTISQCSCHPTPDFFKVALGGAAAGITWFDSSTKEAVLVPLRGRETEQAKVSPFSGCSLNITSVVGDALYSAYHFRCPFSHSFLQPLRPCDHAGRDSPPYCGPGYRPQEFCAHRRIMEKNFFPSARADPLPSKLRQSRRLTGQAPLFPGLPDSKR